MYNAWRIIPVSKWLVTPFYKPFRPVGRGTTLLRGLTNHGYYPLTNWDDPPSIYHPPMDPSWDTGKKNVASSYRVKLVGGFNPFETYSSNWIISPGRGEYKNIYLKSPPSKSVRGVMIGKPNLTSNKMIHRTSILSFHESHLSHEKKLLAFHEILVV